MRVPYLLIACSLLCSPLARGDPWQYELLLMPSAQAVGTFNRTAPVTEIVGDFVRRQALTVQLSETHTGEGHFSDIRLQWSAAFL